MIRKDIYDFSCRDEEYFYEPYSGGVYQYDPLLRDIFSRLPARDEQQVVRELSGPYPEEDIRDMLETLEESNILPLKNSKPAEPGEGIEEMYLHISHRCNLNCVYCYAGGGSFGGEETMMNRETARYAVDFLIRESGSHKTVILNFDGGEPLLNFPLVKWVIEYAKEKASLAGKKISFNISTNGTLFNKKIVPYLARERVGIGVSIDGEPSVHDQTRTFGNGSGSYHTIIDNIENNRLFQYPDPIHGRATVTKAALHCSQSVSHLYDTGFRVIYLEPAAGFEPTWAIDKDDLEIIKKEFEIIAAFYKKKLLEGEFFILRNFFQFLQEIHRRGRSGYRCAAGRRIAAVAPNGDLFPCYKFAGNPGYIIGNVIDLTYNQDLRSRFRDLHVSRKPGCRDCWARYLCGGGCVYLCSQTNNDIMAPDPLDCEFTRHIIKLALEIYVELIGENKKILHRWFGP